MSIKGQQGDFLVEAVIALLLIVIIGQGLSHITTKAIAAQGDMSIQSLAMGQMRTALLQNKMGAIDICATPPEIVLPNNLSIKAETQGCGATTKAIINGVEIDNVPKPVALSVTHSVLGGQVVVGGTWVN